MKHLQLLGLCVCVCLGVLTSGCASIGQGTNQTAAQNPAMHARLVNMNCDYRRDGIEPPIRRVAL